MGLAAHTRARGGVLLVKAVILGQAVIRLKVGPEGPSSVSTLPVMCACQSAPLLPDTLNLLSTSKTVMLLSRFGMPGALSAEIDRQGTGFAFERNRRV